MPRAVDRDARRAEIVTAAAAAFTERGLANTAVSDIVRAAGIAQGTFYLYFESKDGVVLAVAERIADAMIERIEEAVAAPGGTAVEKLLALRDVFGDADLLAHSSELVESLHLPGNRTIHDRLTDHLTPRLVAIFEQVIAQGVEEGLFDVSDVPAAAWFVLGGLRSAELSGVPLAEMPAALTTVTELTLRALGHAEPRP